LGNGEKPHGKKVSRRGGGKKKKRKWVCVSLNMSSKKKGKGLGERFPWGMVPSHEGKPRAGDLSFEKPGGRWGEGGKPSRPGKDRDLMAGRTP